jgi:FkbM family methyltransferase
MKYRTNQRYSNGSFKKLKIGFLTLLVLIIYKFAFRSSSNTIVLNLKANSILDTIVQPFKNGIYFYNLNENPDSWWNFECIDTQMKFTLNTKLCIHDSRYDRVVSGQLKQHGLWEPSIVRSFIRQMKETKDANFIDIGSNIGLYSLIAAKYNRSVLSVEPLYENVIRMHKAAHLENIQNRITCIINAISNERKQLSILLMDDNYGGSYVVDNLTQMNQQHEFHLTQSSVLVNSILLDDLVDVISDRMTSGNKFILKIDIEGYEAFAFDKSERFFKMLQIVAIFIEIGKIQEKLKNFDFNNSMNNSNNTYLRDYYIKVVKMFDLFKKLDYEPYETNGFNKLEYTKWRHWPWDVYLRKCDIIHCTDHQYKLSGVV